MQDPEYMRRLRNLLIDSRPMLLIFSSKTPLENRIKSIVRLENMYQEMGGGELVIESVDDQELKVLLKPKDDPANNLVY